MNDELERLILNNRHSIQNEEPLEGHFERFEARLQKSSGKSKKLNFRPLLKIAVALIFILMAVNQVRISFFPEKNETLSLGSISEEYREVEFYYTSSIQLGMNQLETFKQEGLVSEKEQQMMLDEQQEFDQIYQKLLADLKANPHDERVINALIEYYQSRMSVISIIINKLNEVKQQKHTNHELEI